MRKKNFVFIFCGLFFGLGINTFAQDPAFSQNFSNPLYLNPAYAGSLGCSRIATNYRDQWPSISANYVTYSASYDQYVDKLSGGVGFQVMSDIPGGGFLTTNTINGFYAYNLSINENLHIRPAINIGIGQKHIDESQLMPAPDLEHNPNYYFNAGAGVLIAYKNFISGISYDHINRPDVGFFETTRLPSKLTIHSSYLFNINDNTNLTPGIIYQQQQDFNNIIPSLMLKYKHIKLGAASRFSFENTDCIIGMVGFVTNWMSIAYSYDYTVSKLSNATDGSHEISAIFKFNCKNDKEKFKITQLYGF